MKIDRLVLCRPQGGLNDILCQIERTCRYAERFDRTVVVDTNYHSTVFIKDRFSRYFVSRQNRLILDMTEIERELETAGVFPNFLTNCLHRYCAKYDDALRCFVEENTRQPITFDFSKDYAEPLLVHHASGRLHGASVQALSRMHLHPALSDELMTRANSIGPDYVAVHIRNTDYTTNYQHLLNQIKSQTVLHNCKHLFVATDDIACLEFCRSLFPGMTIFSFSDLPLESGRPLHRFSEHDDVYRRNKDAILDLLMLALSRKFILLEIDENPRGVKYSGFSRLAFDLRNSRTILKALIAAPGIDTLLDAADKPSS